VTARVHCALDDGVARLTVDNPPLNLLSLDVRAELAGHARRLAADDGCRVVVVAGAGERAFSAGSDVREFPDGVDGGIERAEKEHAWFAALAELPQPTIAALHGHVLGGGLELALTCDIRIADAGIRLGFPEVGLGLVPCGGGAARLPHLIAPSRAYRLLLTGERIDAGQALQYGLVDGIAPLAGALDLAARIAAAPGGATRAIKATVRASLAGGVDAGLDAETRLGGPLFATEDARRAVRGFRTERRNHGGSADPA